MVFLLDHHDVSTRTSISLTLFLAAIAFQYTVAGYLPTLEYNSIMDHILLFTDVMIMLAFVESILVSMCKDNSTSEAWDVASMCIYSILVLVTFGVFVIYGQRLQHGAPDGYGSIYPDTLGLIPPYHLNLLDTHTIGQLRSTEEADWEVLEESALAAKRLIARRSSRRASHS